MDSAGSPVYLVNLVNFISRSLCPCCPSDGLAQARIFARASVVIPARAGWARFARVGLPGLFGEETALFAAADAAMRPQTLQNHFGRGGGRAGVPFVGNTEAVHVVHQLLDVGELLVAIGGGSQIGEFQFAAQFKPLDDRLEVQVGKALREDGPLAVRMSSRAIVSAPLSSPSYSSSS